MEKRSTIRGDKIGKRRKGKEGMEKKKGGRKEKGRGRKIKEEDEGKRLKRKARRKWRNKRKDRKKKKQTSQRNCWTWEKILTMRSILLLLTFPTAWRE